MANFPELTSPSLEPNSEPSGSSARSKENEGWSGMQRTAIQPVVSVIVVTYSSSDELPDCMAGLLKQSVPIEIFLVDNASPDNSAQMVADYGSRFENVHAILNEQNIGLAAGNNTPMGKCRGRYLLMLNPDTLFRNDNTLEHMVEFLERNQDVGVVGPKNVYANGEPLRSFERSWGLWDIVKWRVIPNRFPRSLYDRFSSYKTQDVLFVSGSCLLIRRNIFEQIGGYDPEYFLTIEDVCDLCIRVKQVGSRVVFLGEEEVVHFSGRSVEHAPHIGVESGNRSTVYHFLKHKGRAQALAATFLLLSAATARVAIATVRGVTSQRYRNIARIYARIVRSLVVDNPIWSKRSNFPPSSKNGAN